MASTTGTEDIISSVENQDNLITWLNDAIADDAGSQQLGEVDTLISSLLTIMEVACEETSAHLERIIDSTAHAVPRLVYDLHSMRDSAVALQSTLPNLHHQSKASASAETAAILAELRAFNVAKQNMEAAREVLGEAESWNSLEFEVTSLLAERSYVKAAERLSEASKSMIVFQNTPEYDSRRTLMVNLQNQLEASLSSALVSAVSSNELTTCKEYYHIFSNIQREVEFRNYYHGARRTDITNLWQVMTTRGAESPTSSTLSSFLSYFYESFFSLLDAERVSIPQVFPDPSSTLSQFITSTMSNLQPSVAHRLSAALNDHGAVGLEELILCFKATEQFVSRVDHLFDKISCSGVPSSPFEPLSSLGGPSSPGPTHTHSRRRSLRMSMSWRSSGHRTIPSAPKAKQDVALHELDWDQELLQPFIPLQVDYGSLEKRVLQEASQRLLSKTQPEDRAPEIDQSRLLREKMIDAVQVADASLTRSASFTYGYGSVALVQALDYFFSSFMDSWRNQVQVHPMTGTSESSSGHELVDLDYTARDWADFQRSVRLLESCRTVFERLSGFQDRLRATLVRFSTQLRATRQDSTSTITSSRRLDQLFEQSVLNSVDLQTLLDAVDPEHQEPGKSRAGGSSPPLLLDAEESVYKFARSCQVSVQRTLLNPLRNHLSTYASLAIWAVEDDKTWAGASNGQYDLQVPTFSLSPTETIQRVADGLLNLPRLLEVYGEDNALAFSLQTLPFLDPQILPSLGANTDGSAMERTLPSHLHKTSLSYKSASQSTIDPELVASAWLSSLTHSIISYLTSEVLPSIRSLSAQGTAQLSSDLSYLSNIASAMAVHHELLEKWKEVTALTDTEGTMAWAQRDASTSDPVFGEVARKRGWTTI